MRQCELYSKGQVIERVTICEDGKALGLDVVQSDWPIIFMRWVTRVESRGNASLVVQELEYRMKHGPLGWLLHALVMRRAVTRNVAAAVQAMIAKAGAAPRGTTTSRFAAII
jgi:hypothetical protein